MNNFELIEAFGVGIIIILQAYNFYKTNRRIAIYRGIFPVEGSFEIFRVSLKKEALELHPRELLKRLHEWVLGGDIEIDVILKKAGGNIVGSIRITRLKSSGCRIAAYKVATPPKLCPTAIIFLAAIPFNPFKRSSEKIDQSLSVSAGGQSGQKGLA